MDIAISDFNLNTKDHDKCKFVRTLFLLVTNSIFLLEVVQKCQLCVLWEN